MTPNKTKRIDEYTRDELLIITPEQRDATVEIEAAIEGLEFYPEPTEHLSMPSLDKTVTLYGLPDIFTDDKSVIDQIMAILQANPEKLKRADYDYGFSYDYKYVKDVDELPVVKTQLVSSRADFLAFKAANDQANKAYKWNKEEWEKRNKYLSNLSDLSDRLDGRIHEEEANIAHEQRILKTYEHYFALSDQDHPTALRFFKDIFPSELELLDKLVPLALKESGAKPDKD